MVAVHRGVKATKGSQATARDTEDQHFHYHRNGGHGSGPQFIQRTSAAVNTPIRLYTSGEQDYVAVGFLATQKANT